MSGEIIPGEPENPKANAALRDEKPPLDLLEPAADEVIAWAMAEGARKYGRQNYLTIPVSFRTYIAAMERHINALKRGEDIDPQSGKPHMGHIGANIHVVEAARENGNLVDDRGPAVRTPEQEAASFTSNQRAAGLHKRDARPEDLSIDVEHDAGWPPQ